MACEDKQQAFNDAMAAATGKLEEGLRQIAAEAESKAAALAEDFEKGNDLAQGVGAAAGTAIGGFIGGPAGAPVGGAIGKTIGSLFVLKIEMHRVGFKLDVPETTMKRQDWKFDSPVVVMKDKEMSFDLPEPGMSTVEGPPKPRTVCRMETKKGPFGIKFDVPVCYVEWEKTWLDVPTVVMKRHRIVMGLPEVRMVTQTISLDVPEFAMRTREFSFDVPRVVLEFVKDAGKKTADAAAAIAQEAQTAALVKEASLREEMRFTVVGPCTEMFDCYSNQLKQAKTQALAMFDPQMAQISESVKALLAQGVKEDSQEVMGLRETLQKIAAERDKALQSIDEALAKLAEAAKQALDQFINKDPEEAQPA